MKDDFKLVPFAIKDINEVVRKIQMESYDYMALCVHINIFI